MVATPSRSDASVERASPVATVGFVGLGDMGGAIATRIIDASWPTVLWARRAEALGPFDHPNVVIAASPKDLAAQVDLVGICVWSDDDVREVAAGETGVLAGCRPGTVVAIHSTILPETVRELAAHAAARGVVVLDAPVTGGRTVALEGNLTVAVGGDENALARCRSVFDAFASSIVRLGDVGAAQFGKLINNALLAANLAVADDALTLGGTLGIDVAAFAEFLRAGSGRSYGLDIAVASRASESTRQAALPPLDKDLNALQNSAESALAQLLHDAAAEGVRRLRQPPATWQ